MIKQKKTFFYTEEVISKRNDIRCLIYQIKRNRPYYVGYTEYRRGISKGGNAEVLKKLVEMKKLPKYLMEVSRSSWCGEGYYCPEIEKKGYFITKL